MFDTLEEIEGHQSEVKDSDQEPVNLAHPDFIEIAEVTDRMGFTDVSLRLADYAYTRAVLEEDLEAKDRWLAAAELLNRAANQIG